MDIILANKSQLKIVNQLAHTIWHKVYPQIISVAQIDYMLDKIYSITALEYQLEQGQIFLLAYDEGMYLGYAAFELNCEKQYKTKLHKLYVLPDYHQKNIGKKLLEFVVNYSKKHHQDSIFLNVNKYNKAKFFYEKQGFFIQEEIVLDIGNGYVMDDYIMQKPI